VNTGGVLRRLLKEGQEVVEGGIVLHEVLVLLERMW
jgi:hypothetical protein